MKCDEVQHLQGSYLDSELDTKTTFEIEQHLKTCPNCARFFAEEEKLDSRLMAGLNQGPRTAALWERIERSLAAEATSPTRPQPSLHDTQPAGWRAVFSAMGEQLQAGWRHSGRTWAGLAAAWIVILALHFTAREPQTPLAAGQQVPSASEMRFALQQKQLLMGDLAVTSEPAPAGKPKAAPPSPRSDRHKANLNA
jgi:anti-sigma factor RsiW